MEDKEIFEMLNNLKKEWEFFYISDRERKMIIDYIINLQEENERLKDLCDKYEEEHNTAFKLWKTKIEEIPTYEEKKEIQDRIKELEVINEEHRKINGELRKIINEAIEYINKSEYATIESCKHIHADNEGKVYNLDVLLNILQGE